MEQQTRQTIQYFFSFIFFIFLTSCSNQKEQIIQTIVINENTTKISPENLESFKLIPLETNRKCLINTITCLKKSKGKFYFIDECGSNSRILIFHQNGQFIQQLASNNRGPNGLDNPRDIEITNDEIYVWDRTHVKKVSSNGKKVERVFKNWTPGVKFNYHKHSFYFFHGATTPNYVTKKSMDGSIKKEYQLPNYALNMGPSSTDYSYQLNEDLRYFCCACDSVFEISNNKITPVYRFDFKKHHSLATLINQNKSKNPMEIMQVLNSKKHCTIQTFKENNSCILLQYTTPNKNCLKVYNKNTKQDFTFNINQSSFTKLLSNPLVLTDQNEIYFLIDALDWINYRKNKNSFSFINTFTQENDNPLLLVCKFNL